MFVGSDKIYIVGDYYDVETTMIRFRSGRSRFAKYEVLSIKDILLYNFNIDEPFIKIPSNIFQVTNTSDRYGNYFYLKVITY